MRNYLKKFICDEYGGETLEFLAVLAIAAGIIAIGAAVANRGNGTLANMIHQF